MTDLCGKCLPDSNVCLYTEEGSRNGCPSVRGGTDLYVFLVVLYRINVSEWLS